MDAIGAVIFYLAQDIEKQDHVGAVHGNALRMSGITSCNDDRFAPRREHLIRPDMDQPDRASERSLC